MVAFDMSLLVSACCHEIIMLSKCGKYKCTKYGKPCKADGTLGEWWDKQQREAEDSND